MTTTTHDAKRTKRAWGKANGATLGGRIQRARVENGLTQEALAQEIGSTRACIASVENGNGGISFERAIAIARELDVSLDYIAGLVPEFGKFPMGDEPAC